MRSILFLVYSFVFFSALSQTPGVFSQTSLVDFKSLDGDLYIDPIAQKVEGSVLYVFDVLSETDSVFIDAKNMKISEIRLNGAAVETVNDNSRLWIKTGLFPSQDNKLSLNYIAYPGQTMYFINWDTPEKNEVPRQVWTQGQGRYTSHWLPSFDDTKEKLIFNLSYSFKDGYTLVSNGELKDKISVKDSLIRWTFTMDHPMSSYLVALAVGKYEVLKSTTSSGVPLELYFQEKDAHKAEWTYKYSAQMFDFFENEIGIDYPWQNYKQIPVRDFLYSGMENTGTTIFSESLVIDSVGYNDQNYINVNAHELAHQWFGNYVTAASEEDHWLQEGFATYYALLAERQIFGEDHYYWKLFESAEQLKALSDTGKGEALLNPRASSLTFYQKGAWALHVLNEMVGEKAFKDGIKNYLEAHPYTSVTTRDFLVEMEKSSGMNLAEFEADWLRQTSFQGTEALNSLIKSDFLRNYMEVAALREIPFQHKRELLEKALSFPVNDYTGQEVVFQLSQETGPDVERLYKRAFTSENLYVRQAIALSMEQIPPGLKKDFESLLEDPSYITMENALLRLWINYPEQATVWLEKTRDIEGFSNKNVKMLWLVINLVTPTTNNEVLKKHYDELSSYTRSYYPMEVRQNAFGYLYQINSFSKENLIDLLQAAQHHNTRFRNYSRKLLMELLQTEEYLMRYSELRHELSEKDMNFLNTRLKID